MILRRWLWFSALLVVASEFVLPGSAFADERSLQNGAKTASATFRMVGTFTAEDTGEPVAGAMIRVLIGGVNPDGSHQSREGATDASGRYAIEVPAGHSRAWFAAMPPGYWADFRGVLQNFVTTVENPVFTKNYVAKRGPVWRVRVVSSGSPAFSPVGFSVTAYQPKDILSLATLAEIDARGGGAITIPGSHGEFQLLTKDRNRVYEFEQFPPATLEFAADFRSDAVEKHEVNPGTQMHSLTDRHGRTATLNGVGVKIEQGVATIEFDIKPEDPKKLGKLTGVIVDEAGEPVGGAAIRVALGRRKGGVGLLSLRATSDAMGRFVLENLPVAAGQPDDTIVSAVVTKDGYAGDDSENCALPTDLNTPRDLGRIRLGKGHSIRIRVVGPHGEPLVGAWVEPSESYAANSQSTVTDKTGACDIRNLKKGPQHFTAHYGELVTQATVMVGEHSAEVTLELQSIDPVPPR